MRKVFVALTLTSLLVLALILSAQAAVTHYYKAQIDDLIPISCTGDLVSLSGTWHSRIRTTADGNGGFHITIHTQTKGSGIVVEGPNEGAKYRLVGVDHRNINVHLKPGDTETFISHSNLIGRGKAPNLIMRTTTHITVNANGVITANVDKNELICK